MRHGLVCVGCVAVFMRGISRYSMCVYPCVSCGTHGSPPPCLCGLSTSYLDFVMVALTLSIYFYSFQLRQFYGH